MPTKTLSAGRGKRPLLAKVGVAQFVPAEYAESLLRFCRGYGEEAFMIRVFSLMCQRR